MPTITTIARRAHAAAIEQDLETLACLLRAHADAADCRDHAGRTLLHIAVANRDLQGVRLLLNARADVGAGDGDGQTPLHLAARSGHLDLVDFLLRQGADPDVSDRRGRTPIRAAALHGRTDAVRLLHRKGARLSLLDAVLCRFSETTRRLLDAGEDPEAAGDPDGAALHAATRLGDASLVGVLIAGGANANGLDAIGRTPLHHAARFGSFECADELLRAGANVNALDAAGDSPLDLAHAYGHADIVRRLSGWRAMTTMIGTPEVVRLGDRLLRIAFPYANRPNVGFYSGPDVAILVDTGWRRTAALLQARLDHAGHRHPAIVINTHDHAGHSEANTLCAADTLVLRGPRLAYLAAAGHLERAAWKGSGGRVRGYCVRLANEEVWLFPSGAALHSPSDQFVYFARARVLFTGDVPVRPETGNGPSSPLLDALLRRLPGDTVVVKGHGREVPLAEAR